MDVTLSKELLYRKYVQEGKKISEIATELGVSVGTIHNRLKKYGIEARSSSDYKKGIPGVVQNPVIDIESTHGIVKSVLEEYPEARNSDNYMYYIVCSNIGRKNGIDVEKMSMSRFFLHLKEYGFPAFETCRRARQKIQATCPELAGNDAVANQRQENEEAYRTYARS